MGIVILEFEVLVAKREDILHLGIDRHRRQRPLGPRELKPSLLEMIEIEVRVAQRVNEVARA